MTRLVLEKHRNLFQTQLMKEFDKSENDLFEYMKDLKDWAATQPHFPEQPNDNILKCFILYNKFSIERAKQKLDMYYTIRTLIPDIFSEHPLSKKMIEFSKIVYFIPLPKPTDDYKRISYFKFNSDYGSEEFDFILSVVQYIHLLELFLVTDDCLSFHIIVDLDGMKPGHVAKINPMVVKKFTIIMEKVFSNRISSIYYVNMPSFGEIILKNIVLPSLNKKLRDRVKIASTTDIMINEFGKERLPRELGGDLPSLAELNEMLLKQFEHYKDRFDKLQVMKVDESRRPEKLENDEVLGYYGNFKKINLD